MLKAADFLGVPAEFHCSSRATDWEPGPERLTFSSAGLAALLRSHREAVRCAPLPLLHAPHPVLRCSCLEPGRDPVRFTIDYHYIHCIKMAILHGLFTGFACRALNQPQRVGMGAAALSTRSSCGKEPYPEAAQTMVPGTELGSVAHLHLDCSSGVGTSCQVLRADWSLALGGHQADQMPNRRP